MRDQAQALSDPLISDEKLIERVGRGEVWAFERIVERYQAAALDLAYGFLGDAHVLSNLCRATPRARRRLATLMQAMSRSNPTAANRISRAFCDLPATCSLNGVSLRFQSLRVSG
ncbi:MAG: hypothetical protein ACRD88_18050 [Terriglobia bacterium]